jgi:hypothetical protein
LAKAKGRDAKFLADCNRTLRIRGPYRSVIGVENNFMRRVRYRGGIGNP